MIEINDLSFSFQTKILKDINMHIENNNQIIALLGPNGAGKTTLLNILANLYQKYIGRVSIKGKVFFLPDISFIPSDLTIESCLEEFPYLYPQFNKARAIQMLNYLKLDKKKKISDYSKGMKEQLHLVFTLSQDVELYLLDEPLAAVDPLTRDILIDLIIKFRNKDSITIISTHLVQDMEQLFDEIIMLRDGKILMHESVESLLTKFDHLKLDEVYKEVNRDENYI